GFETTPPADLTVWDVESKTVLLHQELGTGHAPHVAISPDGKTVAIVSPLAPRKPPAVRLFDIDGRRERTPLTVPEWARISSLPFSPDGRRLAGFCLSGNAAARKASARIQVWDVETSSRLCTIELFTDQPIGPGVTTAVQVAWAPDGSRFVFSPDTGR